MAMTKEDAENVAHRIDCEDFDYCFRIYSNFDEVKDARFHELRKAYCKAAENLESYINASLEE